MSFNEEYLKKLRNSGLRPTKQRIKICKALFNKEKTFHFTVNDLFKMIIYSFFAFTYRFRVSFRENRVVFCHNFAKFKSRKKKLSTILQFTFFFT